MSNYFPRLSPDGKWIVFTKANNFMLLQPDSELYIMPAEGGTPRRMTCNTSSFNSWHSWSPNGKWLVFASKERGPYTQLCLTHIDEDGNDTPAVLLEHVTIAGRAANLPEFVNIRPGDMEQIVEEFLDDQHLFRQGDLASDFDPEAAVTYYKRAIEMNPNNLKARLSLGVVYRSLGEHRLAEQQWLKVIEAKPSHTMAHNNLALLYLNTDRYDEATELCERTIKTWPDSATAYLHLGTVHHLTGNLEQAEARFRQGVRLEQGNAKAHAILGKAVEQRGRPEEALEHYRKAIANMPLKAEECLRVAGVMVHRPELAESLAPLLERLAKEHPKSAPVHVLLGRLYLRQNEVDGAIRAFEAAQRIDPSPPWLKAKIDELRNRKKVGGA